MTVLWSILGACGLAFAYLKGRQHGLEQANRIWQASLWYNDPAEVDRYLERNQ